MCDDARRRMRHTRTTEADGDGLTQPDFEITAYHSACAIKGARVGQ
jgi:hypothetical protein